VVAQNDNTLMNVRLWDPLALLANLKQHLEIRLYYEFFNVDFDRYNLQGNHSQVMVSAHDFLPGGGPATEKRKGSPASCLSGP